MAVIGLSALVITVMVFVIFWALRHKKLRDVINKMHGPPYHLLTGNGHQFSMDPATFFEQAQGVCMMFGSPRRLRMWLSIIPYVLIYGAEECEPVLSSNKHLDKSREYVLFQPWLGLGLLTSYAQKWRPRRKLLTPTFHYDILKDFVHVYNSQTKTMIKKLEKHADTGESFDFYPFITLCALDIISESAMGQQINAQKNKDSDYVKAIYLLNDCIHERQKRPYFWIDSIYWYFGRGKQLKWALDVVHNFTQHMITERQEQTSKFGGVEAMMKQTNNEATTLGGRRRLAFLDLLLDMVEKGTFPQDGVQEEVDTFMFEGHDTTSAGMNWAMHVLGCHPEVQEKCHQELDAIFGDDDRDVTFDDLSNLKYLECVLKEVLRLYPSVPFYGRALVEDLVIGGTVVPAGTHVLILPYMVHRDEKHWPDAESFDPDRFLPENCTGRHPFAYVPFSAGARNCIGQRFALMEEKTVIAWILRYFKITSMHRRDEIRPRCDLILRPNKGVHVKLSLRRKPNFDNDD